MAKHSAKDHQAIELLDRSVLHCDDVSIVVNKEAGWPVHATRDPDRPHLEQAVQAYLQSSTGSSTGGRSKAVVAHRLDVWTSGIVVLARNDDAVRHLTTQFAERSVTKRYEAICIGGPQDDSGELKHYLAKRRESGRDVMRAVRSGGKVAISRFAVLGRGDGLSLVEFELVTGRTHQLRAQTAADGWPILGDRLYGAHDESQTQQKRPAPVDVRRPGQLLHARRLTFTHPTTGQSITVEADPPADFETLAAPLRPPADDGVDADK